MVCNARNQVGQKARGITIPLVQREPGDRLPALSDPVSHQRGFAEAGGSRNQAEFAVQPCVQPFGEAGAADRIRPRWRTIQFRGQEGHRHRPSIAHAPSTTTRQAGVRLLRAGGRWLPSARLTSISTISTANSRPRAAPRRSCARVRSTSCSTAPATASPLKDGLQPSTLRWRAARCASATRLVRGYTSPSSTVHLHLRPSVTAVARSND